MSISEKIKHALADIEVVRKSLSAIDEAHAEAEAVQRLLDARRSELADVERQIVRTREAAAQADADHARWNDVIAKQQLNGNMRIDELQAKLRDSPSFSKPEWWEA